MNHLLESIDIIDSRRSAGCFWRAEPWVFGLQGHPGGSVLEILRNPGRLGKNPWKNPVFLCLGGGNSNMFFSFSPFKLVGTSRPRLSEIETWIKVEVPWGELNLNTLYEHIHPWKLTWNLKITPLKRKIIFQISILGFHVNFRGCRFMCIYIYVYILYVFTCGY